MKTPGLWIVCLCACAAFAFPVSGQEDVVEVESVSIDALLEDVAVSPRDPEVYESVSEAVSSEPERAGEIAAALTAEFPDHANVIVRTVILALPEGADVASVVRAAVGGSPDSVELIVSGAAEAAPDQVEIIVESANDALREFELGGDHDTMEVDAVNGENDVEEGAEVVTPEESVVEVADEEMDTISVDFPNVEIRTILRSVADLYDLNLVIPEEFTGRASITLRDVTWPQVFDIVLSPVGYTYREDDGIIMIVRDEYVDPSIADGRVTVHEDGTLTVDFQDVPISEIVSLVSSEADLNIMIPQHFMVIAAEETATIRWRNVGWQQVFERLMSEVGYGYIERDDIIMIETIERIEAVPPATRVVQVKYPSASVIAEFVQNLSGVQQVQVDSGTNVLIVTASEGAMREVQSLVNRLDQPAQQVMIEAMFVEVSDTDVKDLGIDWTSLTGYELEAGPAIHRWERLQGQADPDFSDLMDDIGNARHTEAIFSAPEFNMILRALQQQTDARLVSNPTIVTMNAEEAEIQVVDYLYRDGAINVFGTGQPGDPVRQSFEEPIELEPRPGVVLRVTPTISGGDLINLQARPEINNIVGQQILGQGQVIPTIRQRSVETKVMVKSGQTLAMSGLVDEDSVTTESKVPLLGDMPVVGRLFRSESRDMQKKNQIIFITATITDPNRHNYTDFIDERRMMEMDLTHRQVQGSQYQRTEEEEEYLRDLGRYRSEQQREQIRNMMRELEAEENDDVRDSRGARTGPRQRR